MNQSTKEIGLPEEKLNNEQTADGQQVSPSIANALVGSSLLDEVNDVSIVGKCANCGVEYHIHQNENFDLSENGYKELRKHILRMEGDMRKGNYNAVIRDFPALLQKLEIMRSLT